MGAAEARREAAGGKRSIGSAEAVEQTFRTASESAIRVPAPFPNDSRPCKTFCEYTTRNPSPRITTPSESGTEQTPSQNKLTLGRMEDTPEARIAIADLLNDGLVLRFHDGRCAFFSCQLLYDILPWADEKDESTFVW